MLLLTKIQDQSIGQKSEKIKYKQKLYEMCGFKIENESKDLFQKTRNPLTEKMIPRKNDPTNRKK